MNRHWWAAIGPSGTVYKIVEGDGPAPMMLPPCSNQDLPVWTHLRESEYSLEAENAKLREALQRIVDETSNEMDEVIAKDALGLISRVSEKGDK